jgi:hypothetical protein
VRHLNMPEALAMRREGGPISPHHGLVLPSVPAIFVDGPSGNRKKRPRSIGDWPHVAKGVIVPDFFVPCSEASGATQLLDQGNDIPMVANNGASGSVVTGATLANWNGNWAQFGASPVANRGFRFSGTPGAERAYDPTMAVFLSFLVSITSVNGGNRTLFTLCSTEIIQILTTGVLSLVATGATTVNGTLDHRHATTVYQICVLLDPIGSSPIMRAWTNLETISISGWTPPGDAAVGKGFGGTSAPPSASFADLAGWLGDRALYMADRTGTGTSSPGSRGGGAQLIAEMTL